MNTLFFFLILLFVPACQKIQDAWTVHKFRENIEAPTTKDNYYSQYSACMYFNEAHSQKEIHTCSATVAPNVLPLFEEKEGEIAACDPMLNLMNMLTPQNRPSEKLVTKVREQCCRKFGALYLYEEGCKALKW